MNETHLLDRITFNPRQCGGRPCIRGMRIRVKDVLEMLAGGATEAQILQDYPYLETEDIRASLEYASAQVDHAVVMVSSGRRSTTTSARALANPAGTCGSTRRGSWLARG